MKVLFLYDGDYPWDIRVDKICTSLIDKGYEVHLLCRNNERNAKNQYLDGLHIHRIKCLPRYFKGLNSVWTFPAFFSPLWIYELLWLVRKIRFDLIIVRDLPLALTAIFAGKLFKVPTILDMAECYPEMLRCTWKFEKFRVINIFVRNPYIADLIEYITTRFIDAIFVMVPESQKRLIDKKVQRDKIYIVSNTPDPSRFNNMPIKRTDVDTDKVFTLIYVGLVNPSRGLDTVIDAVEKYIKRNPMFQFLIIGDGKARKDIEQKIRTKKLDNFVKMLGWINNKKVPDYILLSDVGIVPHHRCSHWDNTIPNKLFDYMAAGIPVIVSDAPPMLNIVEYACCGLSFKGGNAEDLYDKFVALENAKIREMYSTNGRKAIECEFNWAKEVNVIEDAINKLVHKNE